MSQFRPAPSPEEAVALKQWERAIEWWDDNAFSPLDERDHLEVRQCFAFTVDMNDYPTTATRFIDISKDDDTAQNNFLLMLVFLYLVNAMYIRTSIASAREEDDDDEGDEADAIDPPRRGDAPPRAAAANRPDPEASMDSGPNKRQRVKPDLDAVVAEPEQEAPQGVDQETRVRKLLNICRQRGIPIDDIQQAQIDDLAMRADVIARRILDHMQAEEEIPKYWFAVEYVPDREYDDPKKSFIAGIFGKHRYSAFNNLLNRSRTRYWTFHFLTTSTHDFNRELGGLLAKNLYAEFAKPETTVGLTTGQRRNIQQRITGNKKKAADIIGSAENLNGDNGPKIGEKRRRDLSGGGDGSRLGRSAQMLYPWRRYEVVTPEIMADIASNYLGVNVHKIHDDKQESIMPAIAAWSPMHACNVFSELEAIKRRMPGDIGDLQSIYQYSNHGTYFMPTPENIVPTPGGPGGGGYPGASVRPPLYYWRPPYKDRVIFMRINRAKPSNLTMRKFPDQTILSANPFETLYPAMTSRKVCTASHQRIFSGINGMTDDSMTIDEVHMQTGETHQQIIPAPEDPAASSAIVSTRNGAAPRFPPFPRIAGVLYRDTQMLRSKIERSRTALHTSLRRISVDGSYARRIASGALFSSDELEFAEQELVRFEKQYELFDRWNSANLRAMAGYGDVLRDFVAEMTTVNRTQLTNAMSMERPQIERIKPAAPFQISEFLAGPANSYQSYEIFNKLRDQNSAFLKILKPFLDDRTNGLSQKERCCLYKIYQMHAMRVWDMMARGSDSFLPDAAREVYRYIEQNDAYNPQKRPRNIMRKMDQSMDMLSNSLAWFMLHYRTTMAAARPDLLQLAVLTTYDASRPAYDIHMNLCFAGEGGVAKSWTFMMATTLRIPKTYIEVTGETGAANRTSSGAKENWNVMVHHEIERKRFMGENEAGVGDPVIKQIMDRGVSVTRTVVMDKDTNEVKHAMRFMERVGAHFWCANFSLVNVHNSMSDRTIVINMPPSDRIVTAILSEQTKHRENDEHYQTQLYLHRWIQAVVHEIWMAVGLCIIPPPSATLLFVAMHFINERMVKAGIRPFRPREILKFRLLGCILVILNAVISNFLVQGGRYYNRPVTEETIVSLAPQLYMTSTQVIQTIKILSPHFIMQGEDALRAAFVYMADQRKRATGSAAVCYVIDQSAQRYGGGGGGGGGRSRGGDDFQYDNDGMPTTAFERATGGDAPIDWNYQKFVVSIKELMSFVHIQEGGDSLTQHEILSTITELSKRVIKAPPYVRNPMGGEMADPIVSVRNPHDNCGCSGADFCKKHAPQDIPLLKERHNGREMVLLVSTAWLRTEKSNSAATVIHEALYDFFNHRYQPGLHCTTDYSKEFPGTFNTMKIVAPDPDNDNRPIFEVPNLQKLTEQEHRFMHERGRSFDADREEIDDDEFNLWIADRFSLKQPFDVYAALAHQKMLYPYQGKVTQRDLVGVLYSVGHKLNWVGGDAPLFDPNDPLLADYNDEDDLDVPDRDFMVPSEDDPRNKQVPLREEMCESSERFKMVAYTPECIELRQDLYEARISTNTMVGKYPEDVRATMMNRERNAPPIGKEMLTISLIKQLNVTEDEIVALNALRQNIHQRRSDLRSQILARQGERVFATRFPGCSPSGGYTYPPLSIHSSPSSYSPSSVCKKHGPPFIDACDPSSLLESLRDDLLAQTK